MVASKLRLNAVYRQLIQFAALEEAIKEPK